MVILSKLNPTGISEIDDLEVEKWDKEPEEESEEKNRVSKFVGDEKKKRPCDTSDSEDTPPTKFQRLGGQSLLPDQCRSPKELHTSPNILVVESVSPSKFQSKIEALFSSIALSILNGLGFSYNVPSRSSNNQLYIREFDRIVLKKKTFIRRFASLSTVRKTTIMTRIMQLIYQLSLKGIHVTKRDLFYTDVKLFRTQTQSDAALDDVLCMLGCTRFSANIIAAPRGVVVGRLQFYDNGDLIDCTRVGIGGKGIPPAVLSKDIVASDATCILLVEKYATFMRLAEDKYYNLVPCIIITARGYPDVATRMFVRCLALQLCLPVYALVDCDPYGLKIMSVYGCGSKNLSYDSDNLTTPDIRWLGIRPSDLNKYCIPEECRLPMTEYDIKMGEKLLEEDFMKYNSQRTYELTWMLSTKEKAEIQALSSHGFRYLTSFYLPQKMQLQDWI